MAVKFYVLAALCVAVSGAPPAPTPPRLYRQHAPAQLQQIQPFEYYLENQDVANFYSQPQRKQQQAATNGPNGAPSRLESLEPDSEVELIPGAQQPQQPPQQNPVAPNLPGLVPGQRVFIVHMPVPGYRPGTIGGYQPVYIVAAAPQANAGYPPNVINGYQNAVLLDQSGQPVYSPVLGYRGQQPVQPAQHPGYLIAPQLQPYRGPYELQYQEPGAYQAAQPQAPAAQQAGPRPLHLSQLIALQNHANAANSPRTAASNESSTNSEPKRLAQSREGSDSKEADEPKRNARPLPAHAQNLKA